MADYYTQAKQEADASANAKIAEYEAAKKNALDTYTVARQQWDSGRKAALGNLAGQQVSERARNANMMADRGIGVGEGALVNYGRLNAQHEGQVAGVEQNYGDNLGKISLAYQTGLNDLDGKIAAARAQAEAEARELARQLAASAASAYSRGGGGGGGGGGGSATTSTAAAKFAKDYSDDGYTYSQYAAAAKANGMDPTPYYLLFATDTDTYNGAASSGSRWSPFRTGGISRSGAGKSVMFK